jgi:hypothetical protein
VIAANADTWLPKLRGCRSCMSVEGIVTSVTKLQLYCDCVYHSQQQSHRVTTGVQALRICSITATLEDYKRERVRSPSRRNPKAAPTPPWNQEFHTCMRLQQEAAFYKSVLASSTNWNLSVSSATRASRNISYAVFPSAFGSSTGVCSSYCTSMELEMEA